MSELPTNQSSTKSRTKSRPPNTPYSISQKVCPAQMFVEFKVSNPIRFSDVVHSHSYMVTCFNQSDL